MFKGKNTNLFDKNRRNSPICSSVSKSKIRLTTTRLAMNTREDRSEYNLYWGLILIINMISKYSSASLR